MATKKTTTKKTTAKKKAPAKKKTAVPKKAVTKKKVAAVKKKAKTKKKTVAKKKATPVKKKTSPKKKVVAKKKITAPKKKKVVVRSEAVLPSRSADENLALLDKMFGESKPSEKKTPTTPAYSLLFESKGKTEEEARYEELVRVGGEEVFEQEYEQFVREKTWHRFLAMAVGVTMTVVVLGGLWFQVTKGYFEEIDRTTTPLREQLKQGIDENSAVFKESKNDLQNAINQALDELEERAASGTERQRIEAVTQQLAEELQKQTEESTNDTTE